MKILTYLLHSQLRFVRAKAKWTLPQYYAEALNTCVFVISLKLVTTYE